MKKFAIQVVLLVLVIGGSILFFSTSNGSSNAAGNFFLPFLPQKEITKTLQINGAILQVELADTPSKRSKGLGGKESLGENEGMLFTFTKLDKYPFWMKGLSFPLDFVWIKGTEVVDVSENVPQPSPGQSDKDLPIYSSKVEVDKVLEVNAGMVKKLNIKIGDMIEIK